MMAPVSGTSSTSSSSNLVYSTNSDNSTLTSSDFLKLFIKELQNQDFTSPMDSSEMMNQITQYSNMQMMQQMASYSKSSYAVSLVGKYVTASRYTVSGEQKTISGIVDKLAIDDDNEYVFYIGDDKFTLDQITNISNTTTSSTTT